MTIFRHKSLPIEIGYSEYCKLSELEQKSFMIINSQKSIQNTNNSTTVNNNQNTTDVLGLGEVAAVTVGLPLVLVGSIFGIFDL